MMSSHREVCHFGGWAAAAAAIRQTTVVSTAAVSAFLAPASKTTSEDRLLQNDALLAKELHPKYAV